MPFGFSKKVKEKKPGRDPIKNHEKKDRDRSESSRHRAQAYEQERREKEKSEQERKILTDKKMQEDKIKIQELSNDLREKSEHVDELVSTIHEQKSSIEKLSSDIEILHQKNQDLESRIASDDNFVKIEPKYYEELQNSTIQCKDLETSLTEQEIKLSLVEQESISLIQEEQQKCQFLRNELEKVISDRHTETATLRQTIDSLEGQLKLVQNENEMVRRNENAVQKMFEEISDEKNVLENELKNSMKANHDLEMKFKKIQEDFDRRERLDEMRGLGDKLKTVEDQLSEAMFQNQEKDRIILEKDDQLKEKQNKIYRMTDELSNRDEKIEKQETTINNLKYKMKDDAERFESQFEETMMMHSRQLQSIRQSQDNNQSTRLEADVKRLREQLKIEQESGRAKVTEVSELKTKMTRLENRSRNSDDLEQQKLAIERLKIELKAEKSSRNEEKLNYETIIQNLRGHMLNIFQGNVSPENEKLLNMALQSELKKQNKLRNS